ncbi:hypothetical protein FKP32DRAFT_278596 [Trametes sanguinea]|nr:hypothetical protein FKP32DRAFT_278596 [Trametes sanguinea]
MIQHLLVDTLRRMFEKASLVDEQCIVACWQIARLTAPCSRVRSERTRTDGAPPLQQGACACPRREGSKSSPLVALGTCLGPSDQFWNLTAAVRTEGRPHLQVSTSHPFIVAVTLLRFVGHTKRILRSRGCIMCRSGRRVGLSWVEVRGWHIGAWLAVLPRLNKNAIASAAKSPWPIGLLLGRSWPMLSVALCSRALQCLPRPRMHRVLLVSVRGFLVAARSGWRFCPLRMEGTGVGASDSTLRRTSELLRVSGTRNTYAVPPTTHARCTREAACRRRDPHPAMPHTALSPALSAPTRSVLLKKSPWPTVTCSNTFRC